MSKVRTTVYLDEDIVNHARENKINISQWLNAKYTDTYLSISTKMQELDAHKKACEKLELEIAKIKQRQTDLKTSLTWHEQRFIAKVIPMIRDGYDYKSLHERFCNEHNRTMDFSEFRALVEFYESQHAVRAEMVYKKKKRK